MGVANISPSHFWRVDKSIRCEVCVGLSNF
jgi:hypothetical protein